MNQWATDLYRKAYDNPGYRMGLDRYTKATNYLLEYGRPGMVYCDVATGMGEILEFAKNRGLNVHAFELTGVGAQGVLPEVKAMPDITAIPARDKSYDLVTCLDVMEHLEPERVESALEELWRITQGTLILSICWAESVMNPLYHLTLREPEWWTEQINQFCEGRIVEHEQYANRTGWWIVQAPDAELPEQAPE